nr:hypothetical protein BaRGS_020812 [Batillaria attramentaria]
MICLWVWAAESSFQSGTCLCKVIVVWDSIYLLCVPYTIDYYFDSARRAVFISDKDLLHFWYSLSNLAQLASLQTTVLVTISRWAAVYFPLKMRHKLTKSTMYSVCVGMFTWSLCLESMEMVASRYEKTNSSIITVRTAKVIAGLVLPPVVMTTLTLVVFFLVGDRELLRHMAIATIFVQMIYASFNLPVYLVFAPRFRHLLNKRVKKVTAGDRISLPRPKPVHSHIEKHERGQDRRDA